MADLRAALVETKGLEGAYSNDAKDPGGETVWGIARNFHPDLVALWAAVDRRRLFPDFPKNLDSPEIHQLVDAYYRASEWGAICGPTIKDQLIANELFDTAVNIGPVFAIQFLQLTLNSLNRGGTLWPDLQVDGHMGPLGPTLVALNTVLAEQNGFRLVWQGLNSWQDCYYQMGGKPVWVQLVDIIKNTPVNKDREDMMRGWRLQRAFNSKAAKAVYH